MSLPVKLSLQTSVPICLPLTQPYEHFLLFLALKINVMLFGLCLLLIIQELYQYLYPEVTHRWLSSRGDTMT